MNNHNELDQIVESFLQPKKSTTLGMKELFALFEEVERLNEILSFNKIYLNLYFVTLQPIEFTELDINYLDVNFLEDLLDIIDALASKEEVDRLAVTASGIDIRGTDIGQDTTTQIITLIQGSEVKLIRNVANYAEVIINGNDSYTVIFIQDDNLILQTILKFP